MDFRRIRVQDPSQSPLPFSHPNKPVFWTEPWDNSHLLLCLDACITEYKCGVTNIKMILSHKGALTSSYFSFEILPPFGQVLWNKVDRTWSHLACTQHLQLKHVVSGSLTSDTCHHFSSEEVQGTGQAGGCSCDFGGYHCSQITNTER